MTITSTGIVTGGGGVLYQFVAVSECIDGKQLVVEGTAGGFALGVGGKSRAISTTTFVDSNSTAIASTFGGTAKYVSASAVTLAGGGSFSLIEFGEASSFGSSKGIGVDVGFVFGQGFSKVNSSREQDCSCEK